MQIDLPWVMRVLALTSALMIAARRLRGHRVELASSLESVRYRSRFARNPVVSTSQFVGDLGDGAIIDEDDISVVYLDSVVKSGIVGGCLSTPASSLHLKFHSFIGELE